MKSKIEWTEETLNWVTGCTKISAGCKNCYAETMTKRLQAMSSPKYKEGFNKVVIHESIIYEPIRKRKPRIYFVNSMADTFHDDVPNFYLVKFFTMIKTTPHHIYQVLTKRHDNLLAFNKTFPFKHIKNLWAGVTVENADNYERIEYLRQTDAHIKFLSCEPLLGSLHDINLTGIDWVIVGGESGPNARPMQKEWVEELLHICLEKQIPFFFKQWGGVNKKKAGRLLHGKLYSEMPAVGVKENEN